MKNFDFVQVCAMQIELNMNGCVQFRKKGNIRNKKRRVIVAAGVTTKNRKIIILDFYF